MLGCRWRLFRQIYTSTLGCLVRPPRSWESVDQGEFGSARSQCPHRWIGFNVNHRFARRNPSRLRSQQTKLSFHICRFIIVCGFQAGAGTLRTTSPVQKNRTLSQGTWNWSKNCTVSFSLFHTWLLERREFQTKDSQVGTALHSCIRSFVYEN